jgi:hypothetical protein
VGGVGRLRKSVDGRSSKHSTNLTTPTPNPSPQGGGEQSGDTQ